MGYRKRRIGINMVKEILLPGIEELEEACENHMGWCTNCGEWTHDCCEPDARGYRCPKCDNDTVFGAYETMFLY
jgi:tRNA(Ile2) C34 agmatinyltransferase TiaS